MSSSNSSCDQILYPIDAMDYHNQLHHHQQPQQPHLNIKSQTLNFFNRKSKNRSIYGQPQINLLIYQNNNNNGNNNNNNNNLSHLNHWKSLDSLEYCDNHSNHSFGSNSTSCSDLRTFDQKNQELLVSDLGTSVESFDNEQESLKRCPSVNSTSSGCSVNDNQEELAREAKYFMKLFVDKIFTTR